MSLNRIEELINILNEATIHYDRGNPIISDEEWDKYYFELKELEQTNQIQRKDSPTQKIFFKTVSELEKVTHNHLMLSLDKTKDINELNDFCQKHDMIAMLKLDGLTCSLTYEQGKLVKAETRGNGTVGENVLHTVETIKNVPKEISEMRTLTIDGEVICFKDTFEKRFSKDYKNPRNYAAGALRRLNAEENKYSGLSFIAWDCVEGMEESSSLNYKMDDLENLGFEVVPWLTNYSTINIENLESVINYFKNLATDLHYPIDGIVFKYNNCEYYNSLGATEHHFRGGLAYKFADDIYETQLIRIEWSMGRTGVLTPIAVFDPIDIDGTEVSRASLHNVSVMKEIMGDCCYEGQKLNIYKANQIIPQVHSADKATCDKMKVSEFDKKIDCPICGGKTSFKESESGTVNLICENPNCEGKLINRLDHFCGKKGLDIKGLSKATLEKLIDWGYIQDCASIFNLINWMEKWINKPGFGKKSVVKILDSIAESKNITLNKVISAAGIPLIGTTIAKDLAKRFKTYSAFREAIDSGYEFYNLPNYGIEMHKAIMNFDYTEIDYIVENFLTIEEITEETEQNNLFEGKNFVVTGKLKQFKNRDEIKQKIESLGGKVTGSVTKKTSYLINNDIESTTSKNITAKTLGVPIITEEDFIKFLTS